MITLCKVSKWYPDFQVLKHCSTEVAKGEVWSCAVRGALASRRSSNASMGSSRSRKAPSRSPPFPSATPRRLAEAARPHRHGVSALRAFASPRGAMTRSVRPNRRALLYCSHHPASPTPNLDFAPPLARSAPYCQPAAGLSLVLSGPASSARATKSVAQLAAFVRLMDTVSVQIRVVRPVNRRDRRSRIAPASLHLRKPQAMIATTPRPIPILRELLKSTCRTWTWKTSQSRPL
jgi:hypothetical protein